MKKVLLLLLFNLLGLLLLMIALLVTNSDTVKEEVESEPLAKNITGNVIIDYEDDLGSNVGDSLQVFDTEESTLKEDGCSYCKSMHGPMRVSVIDANSEGNSTIFTGYRIHEDDVIVDKEHQKVFDDTSYVEFDYNYYIEHQTLIPLYQDGLPKKLDVCEMLIYDAVTRDYYFKHIA